MQLSNPIRVISVIRGQNFGCGRAALGNPRLKFAVLKLAAAANQKRWKQNIFSIDAMVRSWNAGKIVKTKHRPRSRKSAAISNSRWAAYATAGAATALAAVNTAEADIHYSGSINRPFNAPPGITTYYNFQLDQPANTFAAIHDRTAGGTNGRARFMMNGSLAASFAGFFASAGGGSFPYLSKLNVGQNISALTDFVAEGNFGIMANASFAGNSQWGNTGTGFAGFRFDSGAGFQYGWARFTMNGRPGNSFTLVDYAWADPGESIATGQVPEPGSLGLLAIGAAGLLLWRKRRSQVAAQK